MQMDLNPTRRTGYVLSMIIDTPTFDERDTDSAHLRQLVRIFVATSECVAEHLKAGDTLSLGLL